MFPARRVNDSVHWYISGITSRIVAESGIPSDVHHLGKILLQSLKDDPDFVLQIDGGMGISETNRSVLERTKRCAIALRKLGLQKGDVITLMAPQHLDLTVPFYAALCLGVIVSVIDMTLGVNELKRVYDETRPKVVFCQSDRAQDVQIALRRSETDAFIVVFDNNNEQGIYSFSEFLEKYGERSLIEGFKPTEFDPQETIAILIMTSGTTGLPKYAAATHKNFAISGSYGWNRYTEYPKPFKMIFVVGPLQWLTSLLIYLMSPILRFTRLQTSKPLLQHHAYHLINTYKPSFTIVSPTYLITLITPKGNERCDLSCFETMLVGGSAVTADLVQEMKKLAPNAEVINGFGMSESTGFVFIADGSSGSPTVGKPIGNLQYRLIDIQTGEDIPEPHKNGELWIKGPSIIKSYYRNQKATTEAFSDDRWFKTGDMFYRDENFNFFFVERIKMLLNHQISPVELETTIRQHPGVLDVAVTGVPDKCGDLPVACVVKRPGHDVTAEDIKRLVKENLTETKQLRGGVIFLDKIPQTASTKIDRRKIKEIAYDTLVNQKK